MVYITGDTHAKFSKFNTKNFPEQKEMTRDDIVIVCGDFGLWHDNEEERCWLDWLENKSFTLCFVDGNHENFDRLYSDEFEIVDFHGGKAHKIRENIYHLMRGHVFEFDGKKFFAFGGASSHDIDDGILDKEMFLSEDQFLKTVRLWNYMGKMFRVNHMSWWKQELPSQEEMDFGEEILRKHDYKVDYVITHSLPQEICSVLGFHDPDTITTYFNKLLQNGLKFKSWYAGHFHKDDWQFGQYNILYHKIERIL